MIIVVCESVPTSESGYATFVAIVRRREHHLAEVLEVDLVADAGAGRHDAEVVERVLAPAQELVALLVALELEFRVDEERGLDAVLVDLHRVVDDEVDRLQRIDALRVAAERDDGVAHGGEVDDARHAGEILEQHAARAERDLLFDRRRDVPVGQRLDVRRLHERAVFVAQQVLEQDLEREGKAVDVALGALAQRVQSEDGVGVRPDLQGRAGLEGIGVFHPSCVGG